MKKITAIILCLSFGITFAQNPEKNLSGEISTDYVRPGLLILNGRFNNGTDFDFENVSFPNQFDRIEIDNPYFDLGLSYDEKEKYKTNEVQTIKQIEQTIKKQFSGKFISSMLSIKNGQPDWEKLFERSRNSLTESQRNQLKNLFGSSLGDNAQNLLLDPILDNNYILVVSPSNFQSSNEKGISYSSDVVYSVFKIEVGEGVDLQAKKNTFMSKFNDDFSKVSSSEFPVTYILSGRSKWPSVSQSEASNSTLGKLASKALKSETKTPEELRKDLDDAIVAESILRSSMKIEAFKPRSIIQDGLMFTLGSKENLKIDDRYFSYERIKDENGNIELKRRGIDRVKKVGNNSLDLTETDQSGEMSVLYGDGGRKTRTGYISMAQPDRGFGVSAFIRNNPGVRFDYRTKVVPNLMVFVDAEFVQGDIYNIFGSLAYPNATGTVTSVGLQKYFNLGRKISLVPFASYGMPLGFVDQNGNEIPEENQPSGDIIMAGARLALKFGPSIQLIPEYTLNIAETFNYSGLFEDKTSYLGFSLRYNF